MQRILHSLSCLLLALALILTGPGGAGAAKGAMLVEICADGAPGRVWIDAEGNEVPSGTSHAKCLDCLLFAAPLPDPTNGLLNLGLLRPHTGLSMPDLPPIHPIAHLRPLPRGPPVLVSEDLRLGDPRPHIRSLHPLVLQVLDFHQAAYVTWVTDLRAIL